MVGDSAGNLYGTAGGGANNAGVVYKVNPSGRETMLHTFTGGSDGGSPFAGVIRDSAGNLYGTAWGGGAANHGVIYKLDASGNFTVLHNFTGGPDGGRPYASLIQDSAGNLYGTTFAGGADNQGVVFKVNTSGHLTVLHSFTGGPAGADGAYPFAGLSGDAAGNLYGTTEYGGTAGQGTVFKVDTTGNETVLYNFTAGADGGQPKARVILDTQGNLYGTTLIGGAPSHTWAGVVFKLDPAGNETVLHSFGGANDGRTPVAGLTLDSAGNLYGTAQVGPGECNCGVLFKLTPQ